MSPKLRLINGGNTQAHGVRISDILTYDKVEFDHPDTGETLIGSVRGIEDTNFTVKPDGMGHIRITSDCIRRHIANTMFKRKKKPKLSIVS